MSKKYGLPEARLGELLPKNTILYTTMEPCAERLSGNQPCVDKILGLCDSIKAVYIGIKEPENSIAQSILVVARKKLQDTGIHVAFVEGMEDRVLEVTMAGHEKEESVFESF